MFSSLEKKQVHFTDIKNILLGPDSDLQTSRPLKLKVNSRANFCGCGVLTHLTNIYRRSSVCPALSHRIMLCDKIHLPPRHEQISVPPSFKLFLRQIRLLCKQHVLPGKPHFSSYIQKSSKEIRHLELFRRCCCCYCFVLLLIQKTNEKSASISMPLPIPWYIFKPTYFIWKCTRINHSLLKFQPATYQRAPSFCSWPLCWALEPLCHAENRTPRH